MIKLENAVLPSPEQWKTIIMGARNPLNSWENSDSEIIVSYSNVYPFSDETFIMGDNDRKLLRKLSDAGADHGKFMRMINVYVDITAPLYWILELDTYKVGTVTNSCSKMHKLHAKKLTLEDFSCEHLDEKSMSALKNLIDIMNEARNDYNDTKNKDAWWQMIQLLPSSYNQKRTVMLNYAVLKNIYHARKNHKLDEWHEFCDWIEKLPYSELITGKSHE